MLFVGDVGEERHGFGGGVEEGFEADVVVVAWVVGFDLVGGWMLAAGMDDSVYEHDWSGRQQSVLGRYWVDLLEV